MDSYLDQTLEALLHNPWAFAVQLLLTVCILTRTFTQFSPNIRPASFKAGTKAIPRASYWFPVIGNTPSFYFQRQTWLLDISKSLQSNIFGLNLYGRNYVVVTSLVLQEQLTDSTSPVSTQEYEALRRSRFFANRYGPSIEKSKNSQVNVPSLFDGSTTRKLTHLLEVHSYNLISPSKSWVDQAQWERGSSVEVLQDEPILKVSATLTKLIQEFAGHVVLSCILSTSFTEANSGFVADFFQFGSGYNMFMTGLPYWIAPGLGPPALAREKCLLALDSLVDAISAEIDGKSMSGTGAGMLYDLDDVHKRIWDIIKRSKTGTTAGIRTRKCSCEILEAVWSSTFSSINIVLWMVIYLFDKDGKNKLVLEQIKTETQKAVKVVKPKPTGLPFKDPPRLEFIGLKSQEELEKQCPTLFGAVLECLRLETEPEQYFTVHKDFILTVDAAPDPTSTKKPALLSNVVDRFQLTKGDRVYAAYGTTYKDSYFWDRPRRFAPNRYGLSGDAPTIQARLPRTNVTRHFGDLSQSIYIVMALLSFYEFESVKHPGTKIVAAMAVPNSHVKATISRRKL